MEPWCGYIDMLATREIAKTSPQYLASALDSLHSALYDAFPSFEGAQCAAFSDGAFLSAQTFEAFPPFLRRVRNQLFQAGYFFRCSWIPGRIEVHKREFGSSDPGPLPPYFSLTFGRDAPEAYQRESLLHGIGCIVDSAVRKQAKFETECVVSFYVEKESKPLRAVPFIDIKFSEYEMSAGDGSVPKTFASEQCLFDRLIAACHKAHTQSDSIANYYIPPIATAIRSVDVSEADYRESGEWVNLPYVYQELLSGGVARALRGLPAVSMLYLAMFDHLYLSHGEAIPPRIEKLALRQMVKVPGTFRNLNRVPMGVISESARSRLIELKVADARARERAAPRSA